MARQRWQQQGDPDAAADDGGQGDYETAQAVLADAGQGRSTDPARILWASQTVARFLEAKGPQSAASEEREEAPPEQAPAPPNRWKEGAEAFLRALGRPELHLELPAAAEATHIDDRGRLMFPDEASRRRYLRQVRWKIAKREFLYPMGLFLLALVLIGAYYFLYKRPRGEW